MHISTSKVTTIWRLINQIITIIAIIIIIIIIMTKFWSLKLYKKTDLAGITISLASH